MKSIKFLWSALFVSALVLAGCKSGADAMNEVAEGAEAAAAAAAEAAGSGAAAVGDLAAAGAEAAGSGANAVAEGAANAAEGAVAAAEGAVEAVAGSDFTATAEALHGTWNADFQALLAGQEMSDEERALANAMLGSATMALTFAADGNMNMAGSMMGQEQNESGTYTIVSTEGNTMVVAGTTPGEEGEEPKTETLTVTFASATSMTMSDDSGESIPFNRAQ